MNNSLTKTIKEGRLPEIRVRVSQLDSSDQSMNHIAVSMDGAAVVNIFTKAAPDRYELDAMAYDVRAAVKSITGICDEDDLGFATERCLDFARYQVGIRAARLLSAGSIKSAHHHITITTSLSPIGNGPDRFSSYDVELYENTNHISKLSAHDIKGWLTAHPETPIYQITPNEIVRWTDCAAGKCSFLDTSTAMINPMGISMVNISQLLASVNTQKAD